MYSLSTPVISVFLAFVLSNASFFDLHYIPLFLYNAIQNDIFHFAHINRVLSCIQPFAIFEIFPFPGFVVVFSRFLPFDYSFLMC